MSVFFNATVAARCSLLLVFLLSACAANSPEDAAGIVAPVQSPNDSFSYRLLTLNNGLKALLISDPDTPKAAASLDVHVGSGDNPAGRGGLAHFLEHMLFLGTKKYPDAAEYERYITEHGGTRNAYTSFEHTNYFFDIDAEHLEPGLDRFAQFFIAPTFDAQYVERERNAVEAEYQMGLKSDSRRGLDVLQTSMNPEHPFSQFAVGSLESLADREGSPVRDELIEFYERYYSADNMRLAIMGRESLDELEALVTSIFASVPERDVTMAEIEEPIFIEAQLPMLLKVKPMGTQRQLQLNFAIPDFRAAYHAKPMAYISNLVGHEGQGSLLSALKARGLADGLSSGTGLEWRGGALFSVTVSLTEQGVKDYEAVLGETFAYLDMLRSEAPKEWIYAEQSALAEQAFRFREPSAPIGYVSSLSRNMHYYLDPDVLRGPYMMEAFDRETIEQALALLTPSRAQVVLTAPEVTTDGRSPYYEVPFSRLGPEALMVSRWQAPASGELHLPSPNKFIAEDLERVTLDPANPRTPELRVDTPRQRIWFRQSEEFRVPRGALYLSFRSPLVAATATDHAASSLYTRMVTDAMNEYTYPALLAGLGFNFYRHSQGISMRISGYSDKQFALLDELLQSISSQAFASDRFERLRREMVLQLQNRVARRPTSQLMDELRRALNPGVYSEQELIEALEKLDIKALTAFRNRFWDSARAEGMLFGNYQPSAVADLSDSLSRFLADGEGLPAVAPRVLALEPGESLVLSTGIEHDDAVVAWYLQGDGQSWHDRAMVALTGQIAQSGFFQQLRTEQQLGYIVSSFSWPQHDVPALMMLVQSPSHDASAVYQAMDAFRDGLPGDIDEQQFLRHRQALINDVLKPHKNLAERAEFYWQSIAVREWDFDGTRQLADALETISYEAWQSAYERLFLQRPRSLLIYSAGAKAAAPEPVDAQRFDDAAVLREGHAVYQIDLSPL